MTRRRELNLSGVPVRGDQASPLPPAQNLAGRVAALDEQVKALDFGKANASTVGGLATAVASKASAAALAAVAASVPTPATGTPLPEKVGASAGAQDKQFAMGDHQHPRLTSTTYATLGANGQAVVTFSRTFVNKPGLNLTETDAVATTQPLVMRGLAWQRDQQGLYTGVTIQGMRAQMLPQLNPVSGILSGVITGVNAIASALSGFNLFGGSAAGATVSVIAIARSDVAAT